MAKRNETNAITMMSSRRQSLSAILIGVLVATMIASCNGFTRSSTTRYGSFSTVNRLAKQRSSYSSSIHRASATDGEDQDDFWSKQKALAQEMSNTADMSLKQEQREKFAARRLALVSDTAYFTVLIFCILWGLASTPLTPLSYVFGAIFGTAYSYGLGKYVETLGGSAVYDDATEVQGAGVGQARFAFLILLFVIVGKFKGQGLQEIPTILGFFTYQLASLSQGIKEFND